MFQSHSILNRVIIIVLLLLFLRLSFVNLICNLFSNFFLNVIKELHFMDTIINYKIKLNFIIWHTIPTIITSNKVIMANNILNILTSNKAMLASSILNILISKYLYMEWRRILLWLTEWTWAWILLYTKHVHSHMDIHSILLISMQVILCLVKDLLLLSIMSSTCLRMILLLLQLHKEVNYTINNYIHFWQWFVKGKEQYLCLLSNVIIFGICMTQIDQAL